MCRRYEGGPYKMPPLAPLPQSRMSQSSPFIRAGLDYFGPLYIKTSNGVKKVWVCLYTCMVTRAIHLELIQDMSADEFILGFKRCVSQRGSPVEIVSDNASQFKAASKVLETVWRRVINSVDVQSYVSNMGIKWKFIVEFAPWMGGFYERLVGLVKRSLKKSIGRSMMNLVQIQTVLKEVESVVNSRPLVYVDDDVNSNISLTPGHFLSLNPKTGIPSLDIEMDENYTLQQSTGNVLLNLWKKGQKLLNQFWKLWRDEYLTSLRERTQCCLRSTRIQSPFHCQVGDIILIKDSLPRGCWKIGRIAELLRSRDGLHRSAKLRLPSGKLLCRPLKLLYPIECTLDSGVEKVHRPLSNNGSKLTMRPLRKSAVQARQKIKEQLSEN